MICSSTEVIKKAQALRQNFRSMLPSKPPGKAPSLNLPTKSYEFKDLPSEKPMKSLAKIFHYKLKSTSPKDLSPTQVRSKYLKEKPFSIPSPKKYLKALNSSIKEEPSVNPFEYFQPVKYKIKINLHLPICRPITRDAALSKSSKHLFY
jgi:hypothetical protein